MESGAVTIFEIKLVFLPKNAYKIGFFCVIVLLFTKRFRGKNVESKSSWIPVF